MFKALKKLIGKSETKLPAYVPKPPVQDIVAKPKSISHKKTIKSSPVKPNKAKPKKKAVKKAAPKKKAKKVSAKEAAKPKKAAAALKAPVKLGEVVHFYAEIKVAVVKFSKPPKIGEEVRFKGATTDFKQTISSAQFDHKPLLVIPKGKQVGIKVKSRVRIGDAVLPLPR